MTGLSMDTSEQFQVQNYGVGGQKNRVECLHVMF